LLLLSVVVTTELGPRLALSSLFQQVVDPVDLVWRIQSGAHSIACSERGQIARVSPPRRHFYDFAVFQIFDLFADPV
jgi:hypothetical protein